MNAQRIRRLVGVFLKQRKCPFCGWRGYRFEPFGNAIAFRREARCPICSSLERHRLALLLLKDRIPRDQKVLHVAPETHMIPWLVGVSRESLNIDLTNPAMQQMDLTALDIPDQSRTLIWCSHVLEHIPDDRKALTEMFRVLEPGGLAVLQVPIRGDETLENPSIVGEQDRLKHFLQEDHVRFYGLDLRERIAEAGFKCEILSVSDLSGSYQLFYGLTTKLYGEIFLCHRPAATMLPSFSGTEN